MNELKASNLHEIFTSPNWDNTAEITTANGDGFSYTSTSNKPTGLLANITMFFRAAFRSEKQVETNNATYKKVGNDIQKEYGNEAVIAFDLHFKEKAEAGRPLTKGALLRFCEEQNLGLDK
ncbi:MAG: hypothetical protein ACH346_07205, partial [Chthoniobacterales bacterium]